MQIRLNALMRVIKNTRSIQMMFFPVDPTLPYLFRLPAGALRERGVLPIPRAGARGYPLSPAARANFFPLLHN